MQNAAERRYEKRRCEERRYEERSHSCAGTCSANVAVLCDAGCVSASGIPPGDTTLLRVSPTSPEKSLLTVGRLPRGGESPIAALFCVKVTPHRCDVLRSVVMRRARPYIMRLVRPNTFSPAYCGWSNVMRLLIL